MSEDNCTQGAVIKNELDHIKSESNRRDDELQAVVERIENHFQDFESHLKDTIDDYFDTKLKKAIGAGVMYGLKYLFFGGFLSGIVIYYRTQIADFLKGK